MARVDVNWRLVKRLSDSGKADSQDGGNNDLAPGDVSQGKRKCKSRR